MQNEWYFVLFVSKNIQEWNFMAKGKPFHNLLQQTSNLDIHAKP